MITSHVFRSCLSFHLRPFNSNPQASQTLPGIQKRFTNKTSRCYPGKLFQIMQFHVVVRISKIFNYDNHIKTHEKCSSMLRMLLSINIAQNIFPPIVMKMMIRALCFVFTFARNNTKSEAQLICRIIDVTARWERRRKLSCGKVERAAKITTQKLERASDVLNIGKLNIESAAARPLKWKVKVNARWWEENSHVQINFMLILYSIVSLTVEVCSSRDDFCRCSVVLFATNAFRRSLVVNSLHD